MSTEKETIARGFIVLVGVATVLLSVTSGLGKPAKEGLWLVLWYIGNSVGYLFATLAVMLFVAVMSDR